MEDRCRDCYNKHQRIKLKRKDCIYYIYPARCCECHEVKHIVHSLTFSGRMKTLMGQKKDQAAMF